MHRHRSFLQQHHHHKRLSLAYLIIASVAFGIFINLKSFTSITLSNHNDSSNTKRYNCNLSKVNRLYAPHALCNSTSPSHSDAITLCWQLEVIIPSKVNVKTVSPSTYRLRYNEDENLSTLQIQRLYQIQGCITPESCATLIPCSPVIERVEDPSDALWLRSYQQSSKFVVLFNIGLATLFYFILAIVVDGSIFFPHRQGISVSSASALILLALSALLYLIVIPRSLQFSLFGAGILDTLGYCLIIILLALSLPGLAVIWFSSILFIIFFIGFLFEHLFIIMLATAHFTAVFIMYQLSNTFLHVRLVYFPDDDNDDTDNDNDADNDIDTDENDTNNTINTQPPSGTSIRSINDEETGLDVNNIANDSTDDDNDSDHDDDHHTENSRYDERVLAMGERFMRRIRSNWFISIVPRMLEERALQITQNYMPDHVHEQLFRSQIVNRIAFDDLTDSDNNSNNNNNNNDPDPSPSPSPPPSYHRNSSSTHPITLTRTTTNSSSPSSSTTTTTTTTTTATITRQNDLNNRNVTEATPLLLPSSSDTTGS